MTNEEVINIANITIRALLHDKTQELTLEEEQMVLDAYWEKQGRPEEESWAYWAERIR